jgi:hypothetical protein
VYKNRRLKKLPSVTTIIKNVGWSSEMLMAWCKREFRAGRDPDETSKAACDEGTVTHELIEAWVFGQEEYEPDESVSSDIVIAASEGLREYVKWSEDNNIEYLESELKMVSEEYQYGGTCDGIIRLNGEIVLIDFKTSKAVYDSHILQMAAYKEMVEESTDYKIDRCMVIRIAKGALEEDEPRIQPHFIDEEAINDGWIVFKMLRQLHEYHKSFGRYIRKLNK